MCDYDYRTLVEDLTFSEEFYEEIDEVIKKEVKGILEENKKLSEENRNVNIKISNARSVLQADIIKLKVENEKKEKEINELKKMFGSIKFSINDEVYVIDSRSEKITCPKCLGERKIIAKHENEEFEVTCPFCKGYGYKGYKTNYYTDRKNILALIITKENSRYGYEKLGVSYKFEEEKFFYKTKEEAEAECEKLNKKENEEE